MGVFIFIFSFYWGVGGCRGWGQGGLGHITDQSGTRSVHLSFAFLWKLQWNIYNLVLGVSSLSFILIARLLVSCF